MNNPKDKIILALDLDSLDEIKEVLDELGDLVGCFKIGLQSIYKIGALTLIKEITNLGGNVFLDGKFHDIPNTIQEASRTIANQVAMFTVHGSSGAAGIRAAARMKGNSKLLAVTVLTSFTEQDTETIYGTSTRAKVIQLARAALDAGADGTVCSPLELKYLQEIPELTKLMKVTPGIRPSWSTAEDQSRTTTPRQALEWGADYLVIGRPIMHPPAHIGSRKQAAQLILEEIQ